MKNVTRFHTILISTTLLLAPYHVLAEPDRKSLNDEQFQDCVISSIIIADYKSDYKKHKPAYDELKRTEGLLESESKKIQRLLQEIESSDVNRHSPEYKIKNHNHKVRQYQELQKRYNTRLNTYRDNKEQNVQIRGRFLLAEKMLEQRKEEYKNHCSGKLRTQKSIIKKYCGFEVTGLYQSYSESKFCARWKKPEKS